MSSILRLEQNYRNVVARIARAADSANRDPADIRLVAVTKYVDASIVRMLYELGCRCFGESRPQVLWQKAKELEDLDIEWHMIGHLQTNKVRRTLPVISLLHSGDSSKLIEFVDSESSGQGITTDLLCEVNISGDPTKHGFTTEELRSSLDGIGSLNNIRIMGLMAMASRAGGSDQAKRDFEQMAEFRELLQKESPESISLNELSMGMSGDFEEAIASGATLVRVGSVLFEGV